MSVARPRGWSVVDRRRSQRLVVMTMRMSVVTRRRPRRLAPRIPLIAAGAVPLQQRAWITAVKLAAIRIASLALGMPPAPVSRTDEHPICDRVMITYGRGTDRVRRRLTKAGKLMKRSSGV